MQSGLSRLKTPSIYAGSRPASGQVVMVQRSPVASPPGHTPRWPRMLAACSHRRAQLSARAFCNLGGPTSPHGVSVSLLRVTPNTLKKKDVCSENTATSQNGCAFTMTAPVPPGGPRARKRKRSNP